MTNSKNREYSPRSEVVAFVGRVLSRMEEGELVRHLSTWSRGTISSIDGVISAVKEGTRFGMEIYRLAEQKYDSHPRKRNTSLAEPVSIHHEHY